MPMPWPWKLARACLGLTTGDLHQYPAAGAYRDNEFLIDAMMMVWRVWKLFHTPMSRMDGDQVRTLWTPADIDLYDWLEKHAWTAHRSER
jgi:hypothetical protein